MFKKSMMFIVAALMLVLVAACSGNSGNSGNSSNSGGNASSSSSNQVAGNNASEALSGTIVIDGSSTVYPISQAVAEEFMNLHPDVNVTVSLSGSSNGFKRIIAGEIDIADASRTIKDAEMAELKAKGQEVIEMPVAYDGITVVIHPENDWAKEMTVQELKMIWEEGSQVKKWNQVRPEWPDEEIVLYGPGAASGTFEYFTEAINGTANVSRTDFTPSEDDNVLVRGVSGDKYAMGYFGFSYYLQNTHQLAAVSIKVDENAPAVEPTIDTIEAGSYQPLSRPIFIYPLKSALDRPEVQEFIQFYMSEEGKQLAEEVGYVRLPDELYAENLAHIQ